MGGGESTLPLRSKFIGKVWVRERKGEARTQRVKEAMPSMNFAKRKGWIGGGGESSSAGEVSGCSSGGQGFLVGRRVLPFRS